jgi:hypothetical protein
LVFGLYVKLFLGLIACSLLAWAIIPGLEFLKVLAVALAVAVAFPLAYPRVRGVRKGDVLIAIRANTSPLMILNATTCTALDNGKVGATIGVALGDGTLAQGTIVAYAGFITPARVRLVHEMKPRTSDGITVV